MSEPNLSLLEQGFIISLAISAPVGPTSILCIQRAIAKKVISGLVSGIGAATAQAIQAGIGLVSLNLIISSLVNHRNLFGFASGIFLCYLGIQTFLDESRINNAPKKFLSRRSNSINLLLGDYCSILLLTLINPLAVVPFVAFFTQTYPAKNYSDHVWPGEFVLGVFVGSLLWYGMISVVVNLFPQKALLCRLFWVNRISGTVIAVFGCISIHSVWSEVT